MKKEIKNEKLFNEFSNSFYPDPHNNCSFEDKETKNT